MSWDDSRDDDRWKRRRRRRRRRRKNERTTSRLQVTLLLSPRHAPLYTVFLSVCTTPQRSTRPESFKAFFLFFFFFPPFSSWACLFYFSLHINKISHLVLVVVVVATISSSSSRVACVQCSIDKMGLVCLCHFVTEWQTEFKFVARCDVYAATVFCTFTSIICTRAIKYNCQLFRLLFLNNIHVVSRRRTQ